MAPVMDVAKFIVKVSDGPVSHLKLQKLLYYVQGWHLGIHGTPVFRAQIQAWAHGPVVPEVFRALRHLRWNPVPVEVTPVSLNDPDVEKHIHEVMRVYAKYSAAQLERLSHTEDPWKIARGDLAPEAASQAVITPDSMREFFGRRTHAEKAKA